MDETLTGSTEDEAVRNEVPTVVVAFHPDPAFLGRTLRLTSGSMLLGRDQPASGLELHLDRRMSRMHAELIRMRGRLVVRDLESRNGTFVNGVAIEQRTLEEGDVVRMGSIALVARWVSRDLGAPGQDYGLIGAGVLHRKLLRQIELLGPRSAVVMLEGPPGAGKGRIAAALHEASGRSGPLVTFDCGAVAPGVMHSELFGHAAGAFSGATSRRAGLIDRARGGTLFLDEVGDASSELQSSLLRLLEEGEYRPVGEDRVRRADVRIVAATNRNLDKAVAEDRFRFDLLTRLRRLTVRVPSLSERVEDIPLLATALLRRHLGEHARLHRSLAFALLDHDWKGNIRELDAVMERAAVGREPGEIVRYREGLLPRGRPTADISVVPPPEPVSAAPRRRRRRPSTAELDHLLRRHQGNVTKVAEDLGAARHSVYRWIESLQIDLELYR